MQLKKGENILWSTKLIMKLVGSEKRQSIIAFQNVLLAAMVANAKSATLKIKSYKATKRVVLM